MAITRTKEGYLRATFGPVVFERLGCIAVVCFRFMHVIKVGRRFAVHLGRHAE